MASAKQAGKNLKKRLIDQEISITDLAKSMQRPRASVSRAINQGKHPLLLKKVKEALGV